MPDLQPGRSFCFGHRYSTSVSFLGVEEVDVEATTVTWSVTTWTRLDIPSW